jgi:hypothetical protein
MDENRHAMLCAQSEQTWLEPKWRVGKILNEHLVAILMCCSNRSGYTHNLVRLDWELGKYLGREET